ncbi:MAG: DUF3617 domain-containing protein [Pseudomonadota bacterium]
MRQPILALSLVLIAAAAHSAENNMRPGLWEMTATSNLLALVRQIPPDQMQKLSNLARRYGFEMPQIQDGAATSRVCISQQMADRKIPPNLYHSQSGCSARNATRNGSSYTMDLVCAGADLTGSGKAQGTFTSAESFSGRTEFSGAVRGTPVSDQAVTSGRWIGADCGSVRPAN